MGVEFFGTGGGGDVGLCEGFLCNVEGLEGGLELLSSLGEGCFDELLGYGPGGEVGPGDGADVEDGGVDVRPGVEVVLFDGGEAFGGAEDLEHGVKGAVSWLLGLLGEAQGFFFLDGEGEGLEWDVGGDELGYDLFDDVVGEIGDYFGAV